MTKTPPLPPSLAHLLARRKPSAPAPAPASAPAPEPALAGLARALAPLMPPLPAAGVDADAVRGIVAECLASQPPRVLRIEAPAATATLEGRQHYRLPLVIRAASAGVPLMLVGPAGTAKTTAAERAAEALGRPFVRVSVSRETSRAELLGCILPSGAKSPCLVREAFEHGKLLVLDEADAGGAGLVALNALTANGNAAFHGEMVPRHPAFAIIATANTWGSGAAGGYRREQMDAALLDRFAMFEVGHDPGLEASLCGAHRDSPACDPEEGGRVTPAEWLRILGAHREAFRSLGIQHPLLTSMRPAELGARLAAAGIGKAHLLQALIRRGMPQEQWAKVESNAHG